MEQHFKYIYDLIQSAQEKTFAQINRELVGLYWNIGKYLFQKIQEEGWGKSTIQNLSDYIKIQNVDLQGFTVRNFQRMKLFYETYYMYPNTTTLLSQLQWSTCHF